MHRKIIIDGDTLRDGWINEYVLENCLKEHFIITDDYLYDGVDVKRIEMLDSIRLHVDKSKTDNCFIVGLVQVTWDCEYDKWDVWYKYKLKKDIPGSYNRYDCIYGDLEVIEG